MVGPDGNECAQIQIKLHSIQKQSDKNEFNHHCVVREGYGHSLA